MTRVSYYVSFIFNHENIGLSINELKPIRINVSIVLAIIQNCNVVDGVALGKTEKPENETVWQKSKIATQK